MLEIQNLLRTSLDKPKVTELETNAILYEKLFGNQNGIGLGPVIGTVTETVTETIPNTINQENI